METYSAAAVHEPDQTASQRPCARANPPGPGYALLAISFFIFAATDMAARENQEHLVTIFFVHYQQANIGGAQRSR